MKKLFIILFISLLFLNFKPQKRKVIKKGMCLVQNKKNHYPCNYEYFKYVERIQINENVFYITYFGLKIENGYYLANKQDWLNFKDGDIIKCELWSSEKEENKVLKMCKYTTLKLDNAGDIHITSSKTSRFPEEIRDPTQLELPYIYRDDNKFISFIIEGVELWK
jgi:hypothetical protein